MQRKLFTIAAFVNIGIGLLGVLTFFILAFSEQIRGGEPLSKWIPALAVAVLCVISGSLLLQFRKKL